MCAGCGARTSVTAGTIFDRTRTPLTVWFTACWLFATQKDGISALSLQRVAGDRLLPDGLGDAAPAALGAGAAGPRTAAPARSRWTRRYIGGEEPGLRGAGEGQEGAGRRARWSAVEPKGIGRCRMAVLPDASSASLRPFLTDCVEPGAAVITDGWQAYRASDPATCTTHDRAVVPGAKASELLPGVHRVASLAQALAAGHPPGLRRRGAPDRLPRRVRLPLQPPALTQPRHAVLPGARARRRSRPGALPRSDPQPATRHRAARRVRRAINPMPPHERASARR